MSEPVRNDNTWDVTTMTDAALVVLAQGGQHDAETALILRHRAFTLHLVARLGARAGLGREDVEDAHQQAYFWQREALMAYVPARQADGNADGFQGFLGGVLGRRVYDFVRGQRRFEAHHDRSVTARQMVSGASDVEPTRGTSPAAEAETAAVVQAQRESQAAFLEREQGSLTGAEQALLQGKRAGQTVGVLAAAWGLPRQRVQRLWQQLRCWLRRRYRRG